MSERTWTAEQALDLISRAHDTVNDLCTGRAKWTMNVPVQEDDPDILITDALGASHPYVAACQGAPESIQAGAVKAMADALRNCDLMCDMPPATQHSVTRALRLYHGDES